MAPAFTCHLQTRIDPAHAEMMGTPSGAVEFHQESQAHSASLGNVPENRLGQHRIHVEVEMVSVLDWGMLGYLTGAQVEEDIPVLTGTRPRPA